MESRRSAAPRIYHVAPKGIAAAGQSCAADFMQAWQAQAHHAVSLGFDHLLCAPLWSSAPGQPFLVDDPYGLCLETQHGGSAPDAFLAALADASSQAGCAMWLDISLAHAWLGGKLASAHPQWYGPPTNVAVSLDPRLEPEAQQTAHLILADGKPTVEFLTFWRDYFLYLADTGVSGFRVRTPQCLPAASWQELISAVHASHPECRFTAWTPGLDPRQVAALAGGGFHAVYNSLPWWNFRDDWFVTEHERLARVANVIAPIASPDDIHPHRPGTAELLRLMHCAAELGDGILLPMQADTSGEHGDELAPAIARANLQQARQARGPHHLRQLAGGTTPFTLIHRRASTVPAIVLINPSPEADALLDWDLISSRVGGGIPHTAVQHIRALEPSGVLALALASGKPVQTLRRKVAMARQREALAAAMHLPRIVIQDLEPSLPVRSQLIKCCTGEPVQVRANIFIDGHDVLAARVLWRAVDEEQWAAVEMQALGNDAWQASFTPQRMGRHEYTIEAWRDVFGTYRSELGKKHGAGVDVSLEILEGRELLAAAGIELTHAAEVQDLLGEPVLQAMRQADLREFNTRLHPAQALNVERPAAAFASWYEMFPRSQSAIAGRHGTFRDVMARLPYVRDMGFDVLYFPPIHPIGRRNRKGRNNSLVASDSDPGSPYAIGAEDGGHDALHAELGTLADFRELVLAAAAHGLEIALDFAIQCSPDHPWLRDHPDWFAWRADGSLRYAENPPKKYEDIVNVDFHGKADKHGKLPGTPALWLALRDVVLFWADEGVRTFRVDNPHTKPLPFWQWLIAEVQARYPDTLFLSEAFTRPNMMYHLAKIGFSQSYTYFTWRHTRQELTDYLTEIGNAPVADFFRPHFFVNTPDINPYFLQTSGRAGFLIRAALATTMSGLWGMYNGFELCEGAPVPGKEEYLDSEKYEIRCWDWDRPGNICAEITQLNQIRRNNPALHSHRGIEFLPSANEHVLFYSKATPQRDNVLLIAVSLDPQHAQDAPIELPLWRFGLPDDAGLYVEDLLREQRYMWQGKHHVLHLHPGSPYGIWRVRAQP